MKTNFSEKDPVTVKEEGNPEEIPVGCKDFEGYRFVVIEKLFSEIIRTLLKCKPVCRSFYNIGVQPFNQ
jgi:hypothetical protein